MSCRSRLPSPSGFTLVEVLIVAVILGILAWIVVPQFSSAASDVRTSVMTTNLSAVRGALELYKIQHGGRHPTMRTLADQLTLASRTDGATAALGTDGYPLGPYLQEIPVNPATQTNTVGNGPVGTSAWYYNETTGEFRANDTDADRSM
jgi:type II secretion system protein G